MGQQSFKQVSSLLIPPNFQLFMFIVYIFPFLLCVCDCGVTPAQFPARVLNSRIPQAEGNELLDVTGIKRERNFSSCSCSPGPVQS